MTGYTGMVQDGLNLKIKGKGADPPSGWVMGTGDFVEASTRFGTGIEF